MDITLSQAAEIIKSSDNIIITAHINPDGDAIGSLLALAIYIKDCGKNVTCILDDDIPEKFNFMPNISLIQKPSNIIKSDLLIVLDSSDIERIGKVAQMVQAPILNIDHHISNIKFADYLYLDADAAATGEIIFEILESQKCKFNKDIATCLYTAIATDCGFFRYANTSASTMRIAAKLIEAGVSPNMISEKIEKKSLENMRALIKALESLEFFLDNKVGVLSITEDILNICDNTEGFIDFPRVIDGVEIAILFKCVQDNLCRVSMRSKSVDVSSIAKIFNGGGHKRAAGCSILLPINEAKKLLIDTIAKQMKNGATDV